jgi:hypothetical protein
VFWTLYRGPKMSICCFAERPEDHWGTVISSST